MKASISLFIAFVSVIALLAILSKPVRKEQAVVQQLIGSTFSNYFVLPSDSQWDSYVASFKAADPEYQEFCVKTLNEKAYDPSLGANIVKVGPPREMLGLNSIKIFFFFGTSFGTMDIPNEMVFMSTQGPMTGVIFQIHYFMTNV